MSVGFFDVAMSLDFVPHGLAEVKNSDLIDMILRSYLKDQAELINIKKALSNKRLDGSLWSGKDEEVLREYLTELSRGKLLQLLVWLNARSIDKVLGFSDESQQGLKILSPVINLYAFFCKNFRSVANSKFSLKKLLSFKPKHAMLLSEEEQDRLEQYGKCFIEISEQSEKHRLLVNGLINNSSSFEQAVGFLLQYVKSLNYDEHFFEVGETLSKVEKQLLGGKTLREEDGAEEFLRLLEDSVLKTRNHIVKFYDLDTPQCSARLQELEQKLNYIVEVVAQLVKNINHKEQKLEADPLTKKERDLLVKTVFEYKRKLFYFLVKFKAFAKEETLHPGLSLYAPCQEVDFTGKHQTSFDLLLSKVPFQKERKCLKDQHRSCLMGSSNQQKSNLVEQVDLLFPEQNTQPFYNQFSSDYKKTPISNVHPSSNFYLHLICSQISSTITELQEEILKQQTIIGSLETEVKQPNNGGMFALGELMDGSNIVHTFRNQNLMDLIAKKEDRKKFIHDEMVGLIKEAIKHLVDNYKSQLELAKKIENPKYIINWSFSQQEQQQAWLEIRDVLDLAGKNKNISGIAREKFYFCVASGGESVFLQNQTSNMAGDESLGQRVNSMLCKQLANLEQQIITICSKVNLSSHKLSASLSDPTPGGEQSFGMATSLKL